MQSCAHREIDAGPAAHDPEHATVLPVDPIPPLKQQLAQLLVKRLDGWSGEMAAELLGTDQPRVSDLRNGRLQRFSLDRLVRFAARVGGDITLDVAWRRKHYIGPRTGDR
jgi:predicted XRE-type DNA-binding protein